jgi:hypothetical protein
VKWISRLVLDITSSFVLDALDALEEVGLPRLWGHRAGPAHGRADGNAVVAVAPKTVESRLPSSRETPTDAPPAAA